MADWFVYIISNNAHTLYTGATNDLPKRIREHKNGSYESSFTARYTFDRCVYYEHVGEKKAAIVREQQIKKCPRTRRVKLIQAMNPNWLDLSQGWSLAWLLS